MMTEGVYESLGISYFSTLASLMHSSYPRMLSSSLTTYCNLWERADSMGDKVLKVGQERRYLIDG
jgi:hypothetical protein